MWQDISTAPLLNKDNEPNLLLLFQPHNMGGYIFVGCFYNERWLDNLGHATDHNPTHWMYLPEYPKL